MISAEKQDAVSDGKLKLATDEDPVGFKGH